MTDIEPLFPFCSSCSSRLAKQAGCSSPSRAASGMLLLPLFFFPIFAVSRTEPMQISKPRKIFIIEDDPLQADMLRDRLTRDTGHDVKVFYTGESCMRSLSDNPEVVIIDYNLNSNDRSAANGMDILTSIKKYLPDTHVIMLSSQERYAIALQSIQKGAEQYVIKDKEAIEKVAKLVDDLR